MDSMDIFVKLTVYRNKTSSGVGFKLSLILGARFFTYNALENSNWDQLQQVPRTQKLDTAALMMLFVIDL